MLLAVRDGVLHAPSNLVPRLSLHSPPRPPPPASSRETLVGPDLVATQILGGKKLFKGWVQESHYGSWWVSRVFSLPVQQFFCVKIRGLYCCHLPVGFFALIREF